MARISKYPISNDVYKRISDIFLWVLVNLRSKNESLNFVNEFLTPTERIMLAKRLAISLLLAKEYSYRDISRTLRVSTATIGTVSTQYKYGSVLKKLVFILLEDEKLEDFWLSVGETISSIGLIGGKGAGSWRYLNTEIKKKRSQKAF